MPLPTPLPALAIYLVEKDLCYGQISSLFVATPEYVELLLNNSIPLGEKLGKHSDVCLDLQPEDFQVISNSFWLIGLIQGAFRRLTKSDRCCLVGYDLVNYLFFGQLDEPEADDKYQQYLGDIKAAFSAQGVRILSKGKEPTND